MIMVVSDNSNVNHLMYQQILRSVIQAKEYKEYIINSRLLLYPSLLLSYKYYSYHDDFYMWVVLCWSNDYTPSIVSPLFIAVAGAVYDNRLLCKNEEKAFRFSICYLIIIIFKFAELLMGSTKHVLRTGHAPNVNAVVLRHPLLFDTMIPKHVFCDNCIA